MNIISSDVEININERVANKSNELFIVLKQISLQYLLGVVN